MSTVLVLDAWCLGYFAIHVANNSELHWIINCIISIEKKNEASKQIQSNKSVNHWCTLSVWHLIYVSQYNNLINPLSECAPTSSTSINHHIWLLSLNRSIRCQFNWLANKTFNVTTTNDEAQQTFSVFCIKSHVISPIFLQREWVKSH